MKRENYYQAISENHLIQYSNHLDAAFAIYNIPQDSLLRKNTVSNAKTFPVYLNRLKAIIQLHHNAIYYNSLTNFYNPKLYQHSAD